jgi:hypothetical protein
MWFMCAYNALAKQGDDFAGVRHCVRLYSSSDASISLVLFRQLFAVAVWWESAEELLCLPNPKATLDREKVNDRLGSLSHVKLVIGRRTADAVGAFEREGKDGVDWALHLTGGMVEKCLRSVSSVGCRCLLAVGFCLIFPGICSVFGLKCVFVSTLITRDIETF